MRVAGVETGMHVDKLGEYRTWPEAGSPRSLSSEFWARDNRLYRLVCSYLIHMSDEAVPKQETQGGGVERSGGQDEGVGMVQQDTVVLAVDIVESVRLMREHEVLNVRRW